MDAPDGRHAAIRGRGVVIVTIAVVVLALVTGAFYRWGSGGIREASPPRTTASPSASKQPTTAQVFTAVAPSVVAVESTHRGTTEVDAGTGVIVNTDGTVLTALHVVAGASAVRLTFADGTASAASVQVADAALDIAELRPAALPSVVVPAVLGRSDRLAVGDSVVAIGNQLGLTDTTTAGVVSGLDRRATPTGGASLSGLIQFDAAVNPGSSGGPLVNGRGEIVGIVVALANPTTAGTFVGVGFAVPITAAASAGGGARAPLQ
jgi:putative serine protease PepD